MQIIGNHKKRTSKVLGCIALVIIVLVLIIIMAVAVYNIYSTAVSDMLVVDKVFRIAPLTLGFLTAYRISFMLLGLLFKAKVFPETEKRYKYCCLIPARNEETVLPGLLDSIKKQNYPQDLITLFVIADNCTDNTAEIARQAGAIVFERINPPKHERRKGYALDFLIKRINETVEGGIESFDGAFILDADNVLAENFFHEMNKAFDQKQYDFFSNYISPKNMTNTLSAYGGVLGITSNATMRRPLAQLGLSLRARGNTPLFRTHIIKDGWKWHALLEDMQCSCDLIAKGVRSIYVEAAETFDEQVEEFKMFNRQRMRWLHGGFIVFCKYFFRLLGGMFTFRRRNIAQRFSAYEALVASFPYAVASLIFTILYPIGVCIFLLATSGAVSAIMTALISIGLVYLGYYIQEVAKTIAAVIREHRHLRIKPLRLTMYIFAFPFISIYTQYLNMIAIFTPTQWKRIKRYSTKTSTDIAGEKVLVEHMKKTKGEG